MTSLTAGTSLPVFLCRRTKKPDVFTLFVSSYSEACPNNSQHLLNAVLFSDAWNLLSSIVIYLRRPCRLYSEIWPPAVAFTSLMVFLLTVFLLLIYQFFFKFHSGTDHSHGIANLSLVSEFHVVLVFIVNLRRGCSRIKIKLTNCLFRYASPYLEPTPLLLSSTSSSSVTFTVHSHLLSFLSHYS